MNLNLDSDISNTQFSYGVKQLLCFVRVLLQNNQIIVLDEATSNVDPGTDAEIQRYVLIYIYIYIRAIKRCFSGKTLITIAHRIDTVLTANKILVIDQGKY